jgi:malate dehydrogenase (oxaloacetate-decarboxylating)(NADP+)
MNQWKSAPCGDDFGAHADADAIEGADVFFGLSVKGALTPEMVRAMARQADHLRHGQSRSRDHAGGGARRAAATCIIATGRWTIPNQVNNVLGFPFIFRGALDVRASTINDAMKIAAAESLAMLAREDVPEEVSGAGAGKALRFGPELHHSQCL